MMCVIMQVCIYYVYIFSIYIMYICHVLCNITYTIRMDNILYPDVCDNPDV